MRWLNKLDRKIGKFAIKNLMFYIIGMNLGVYILSYLNINVIGFLMLIPSLILKGQIWRLITYIFIPPAVSIIWIVFVLYFYYMIGSSLEHEWGSFKFNVYYFVGMLGTTIAAFITGWGSTAFYLNLSLFFAFATLFPDYEILLFFILPVKVKYLAWLNWAYFAYTVIFGYLPNKLAAIASIINYLIFFGPDIINNIKLRRQVYYNRKRYFKEVNKYKK